MSLIKNIKSGHYPNILLYSAPYITSASNMVRTILEYFGCFHDSELRINRLIDEEKKILIITSWNDLCAYKSHLLKDHKSMSNIIVINNTPDSLMMFLEKMNSIHKFEYIIFDDYDFPADPEEYQSLWGSIHDWSRMIDISFQEEGRLKAVFRSRVKDNGYHSFPDLHGSFLCIDCDESEARVIKSFPSGRPIVEIGTTYPFINGKYVLE